MIVSSVLSSAYVENDSVLSRDTGLKIKGRVNELSVPIPCRVRLFHKNTGRLVRDIKTDNDGNYEFNKLLKTAYFIVAHHPASQFNAVIQDNVVPK